MPHFFERVLSTEEKIALVEGLQADYVELRSRRPGAAGISEMLDTLQQRITELKAEL